MGIFSNLRGPKIGSTLEEELPVVVANGSPSSSSSFRRKVSSFLPICVALVVLIEIGFLSRLDNATLVDTLTGFFTKSSSGLKVGSGIEQCEEWLERVDSVTYSRDFSKDPIFISGTDKDFQSCSVHCAMGFSSDKNPDAAFGLGHQHGTLSIIRSMESAQYYQENDLAHARRKGYDIVMTTSLSSDVPVGYFSWAEYDIMAPVQPKTEKALAAAFISNCAARNFRIQALEALMAANVNIDSYGGCHRNRDGRGSVPVVVGAPNIEEFAPSPDSFLHIKQMDDVMSVAKKMKYLADNTDAYNQTLRWKHEGPSDSFKALVDMAAVHSSCRLCIFVATKIREQEEKGLEFKKRPCKCTRGSVTVYHLYVRERGRFDMESIFLKDGNLTLEALKSAIIAKFKSQRHEPIWKKERPAGLRGDGELRVHGIYPLGLTQRQALYNFKFEGNSSLNTHIQSNPCAKFEVVFV
ncbi:PREDICTED: glycoprotein 3-alpha-L-fucosyltransferase A-like isoform X2 [Camelina sativa]|uniref:Fucosyltransferase n=1 Tax=Camelina sativa TaxID=90675 RepID=A0ABM0W5R1_CAMSA|nr:PREDICTED: glycoprotein 3-alpha-L-fucosyltransferase A-like isoform X2 [Camelina sativa]